MTRIDCTKCNIKIPKHHPLLHCSICDSLCHHKCNNLSKAEAALIASDTTNYWTCQPCMKSVLPINACTYRRSAKSNDYTQSVTCGSCYKCTKYTIARFATFSWCDKTCHQKCISGQLGCVKCCIRGCIKSRTQLKLFAFSAYC